MDGGTAAKTKKTELHGMGMEMYDYTNIILYNSLETDGLPVISLEITSISAHSAVCKAKIIAGTDVNVTKRGFCWSSSNENPTISNHVLDNGSGAGNYTGEISGLAQNTTYYVRAYAQTTDTIVYSNPKSFKTYALPSVMTILVTNITTVSAECRGEVLSDGGSTVTERGVCYSLAPNPTINNTTVTSGTGTGSFTCELTGLTKNTKYYVKAYAKNSYGVAYGEEKSFTTDAFPTFQYGGHTYYVAPDPGNRMEWSAANSYCNNLSLEGMTGWKMPTRDELVQMYADRMSIGGFYIDSSYTGSMYWSSTATGNYHYYVRFYSGSVFWDPTDYHYGTTKCRVRPIRRKN